MILTREGYNQLWHNYFENNIHGIGAYPPSYEEYKVRENMVEDYLDIFRGWNTRGTGERAFEPSIWYYPHPFFNENNEPKLKENPCIKYILIGEAAPKLKDVINIANNCLIPNGDKNNAYFYNILHLNPNNPYLNAPRNAFECPAFLPCPENKIQTLLSLASKGVFLLDLFPFAIDYSEIRNTLNNERISIAFWQLNFYSIHARIDEIRGLLNQDYQTNIKLCFLAPPSISDFIALNLVNTNIVMPKRIKINVLPTRFQCVAMSNANVPDSDLIQRAFGL